MPTIDVTPGFVQGFNSVGSFAKGYVPQKNFEREQAAQEQAQAERLRLANEEMAQRNRVYQHSMDQEAAAGDAYRALLAPMPQGVESRQQQVSPVIAHLHPSQQADLIKYAQERDAQENTAADAEGFLASGGASTIGINGEQTPNPTMENDIRSLALGLRNGTVPSAYARQKIDRYKGEQIAQRSQATIHQATLKRLQSEMQDTYGKGLSLEAAAPLFHLVEMNGIDQTKDKKWQEDWNLALKGQVEIPGFDGKPMPVPAEHEADIQDRIRQYQFSVSQLAEQNRQLENALRGYQIATEQSKNESIPKNAESRQMEAQASLNRSRREGQIKEPLSYEAAAKIVDSIIADSAPSEKAALKKNRDQMIADEREKARVSDHNAHMDVSVLGNKPLKTEAAPTEDSDFPPEVPKNKREQFIQDARKAPKGTNPDEFLKAWLKANG